MPPRVPRRGSVTSSCDNLRELASAYMPTLRYALGERHFPVRAESWLQHASSSDWPESAGRHGEDLPVDERRRGTSVVRAPADVSSLSLLGGAPPFDRPLGLEPTDSGPNAIATYAATVDDTFLVFGGWADSARERGDEDYLGRAFSELAAAMDHTGAKRPPEVERVPWQPLDVEPLANVPTMWLPQPVTPTVYAEVEWTGIFPIWAEEQSLEDFSPEPGGGRLTELDGFLSLTYYYLYALRHPVDDGPPARLEGQWEAVSLLFPAERSGERPDGRPASLEISEPPQWVAMSQGLEGGVHRVRAERWGEVAKVPVPGPLGSVGVDSTSSLLYVGRGTHVFHIEPQAGHDWDQPAGSDLDLDLSEDVEWERALAYLVWLLLSLGAFLLAVKVLLLALAAAGLAAFGLFALLAILAIIAIILLLIALNVAIGWGADEGSDVQPRPHNEEAPGDGPQGGSDEPPAGDPHADGSDVPPGTPNAGSPTGRDIAAFDLRVVDVFNHPDERTGFPPARACEHPTWWSYTGGWGVRVPGGMSSGWTSGMRRVDAQRRSWAYHAAAEVARRIDDD